FSRPAKETSGHCFIDAAVLTGAGVDDLSRYGGGPHPQLDLFLD
ncbi:MAG: short chain dehydrogenase, partial [Rhodococcus sp. (in: high G+C Gram-positive bacteria)]